MQLGFRRGWSGHGGVEGLPELDRLVDLLRSVETRLAESVDEGGDGREDEHPIDPTWEAGRLGPGDEDVPCAGLEPEDLLAAIPAGADVTGVLHFVERVLNGFGKIAGVPSDGSRMTGFVAEQPSEDLRAPIDHEKRRQGAEQVCGPPRIRRLTHSAAFHGIAQQAVAEEAF